MYKADITIIGAGIIGLAVAAEVAHEARTVFVLENNETFGQETSSRNSQIIHAGIYYPEGTLKSKTCVEGNAILYQLCNKYEIDHRKIGKLIVAINDEEAKQLEELKERGERNGVDGLQILDRKAIKKMEPNVRAVAALFSPSSGIIDVHALMRYFLGRATDNGARVACNTRVVGIEGGSREYRVTVEDRTGNFTFPTKVVINCGGLHSHEIAHLAGVDIIKAGYNLHYCRGEYFKLNQGRNLVKRLIYPVPQPEAAGLGIHVTPSLDGIVLLGPDSHYVNGIDYSMDERQKDSFYNSVVKFLPAIKCDDIVPEMVGIRPKLQGHGEDFRDFVIREERDKGLPGFVNLIGIESPGLTSSPAIAKYVRGIVEDALKS